MQRREKNNAKSDIKSIEIQQIVILAKVYYFSRTGQFQNPTIFQCLWKRDNAAFTGIERLDNLMDPVLTHRTLAVEYFKFVGFWDTYENISGILLDSGTLKNCRILGLVEYWDCTVKYMYNHIV